MAASESNTCDHEAKNDMAASSSSKSIEDNAPKDIKLDAVVVDVCFHPSKDVIASCSIDGDVKVWSYTMTGENHELMSFDHHKKGGRAVRFSKDGNLLFSVAKDKALRIVDMNTCKLAYSLTKIHTSAIYTMLVIDDYLVATGDDDGCVKVWDFRCSRNHMEEKRCEDFISDMALGSDRKTLLVTSGEGTLTSFNVRGKKMNMQSENFEDEFLSVAIVKGGSKVVVGAGDGALNIFNWGEWGNISDRFPGHMLSIDTIVPVSDDVVCTGSFDGNIRAVHILPNQILGTIGSHGEYPVENLSISHNKLFLASCSHDQVIKFWNIRTLQDISIDPSERPKKKARSNLLPSKPGFFDDLCD